MFLKKKTQKISRLDFELAWKRMKEILEYEKTHKPYTDGKAFFHKLEKDPEIRILVKQQEESFALPLRSKEPENMQD